jgi:Flp pilus assembly protein TadB
VSDRAARETFEALQSRRARAQELLEATERPTREERDHLLQEVKNFERVLRAREDRAARAEARRAVSQRVAAFGFEVLFVAPIASMAGVALGRQLGAEHVLAALLLLLGVLLAAVWVVRPARQRLLRRFSPAWRALRRGLQALE